MSLNCTHAWEEYKKLALARHALGEEFLALSDEAKDFKNVSPEKVNQWRELYGRCNNFRKEFMVFYDEFYIYRAKEIMGDQFYGPEEIRNAYGFAVSLDKIPKIPYSLKELEKAKELGERLVLRISEDNEGNTMTMEHLAKIAQARMTKDEGKLLYSEVTTAWYKDEDFFKKQALKTEWKLLGGNFIRDSRNKNYSEQTKVLRDYLKGIGSLTAAEEKDCSDENLAKIADDVKKLVGLEINQKHRRTPGEVLYDWFLHFKKFKDRDYLESNYDWGNLVSSGGDLVIVGLIDPDGVRVRRVLDPGAQYENLGVVSVR